jgi:endonuclease YncB( thermonuclease family)
MTDPDLYWYRAAAVRVIDGDTIVADIDLGMRVRTDVSLRIADVNTPELHGPDRDAALAARLLTVGWLDALAGPRWTLHVHTRRDGQSFNRYVADVYSIFTGESLNDVLRAAGFGVDRKP